MRCKETSHVPRCDLLPVHTLLTGTSSSCTVRNVCWPWCAPTSCTPRATVCRDNEAIRADQMALRVHNASNVANCHLPHLVLPNNGLPQT